MLPGAPVLKGAGWARLQGLLEQREGSSFCCPSLALGHLTQGMQWVMEEPGPRLQRARPWWEAQQGQGQAEDSLLPWDALCCLCPTLAALHEGPRFPQAQPCTSVAMPRDILGSWLGLRKNSRVASTGGQCGFT